MQTSYDYVLVGGGVASLFAAQTIRERDANGSILIVKAEERPPYERRVPSLTSPAASFSA